MAQSMNTSPLKGGKSGSYQSDRRQQDGGGRRQDNGRQQNNASSGGYKQREHTYEPVANRDSSKRGEAAKGGQQRSGQSDREERKKTPARETGMDL